MEMKSVWSGQLRGQFSLRVRHEGAASISGLKKHAFLKAVRKRPRKSLGSYCRHRGRACPPGAQAVFL